MKTIHATLIGIISIVILGGLGWYLYTNQTGDGATDATATTTPIENIFDGLGELLPGDIVQKDGYTIEVLPADEGSVQTPSLTRTVPQKPATLDQAAYDAAARLIAEAVAKLKKDSTDYFAWVSLAANRSLVGDVSGAEEVLVYLSQKFSTDADSFANLGDFYAYTKVDTTKAITAYERAVAINPESPDYYRELSLLYGRAGNAAKVESTLSAGIKANEGAIDLQVLLARHYVAQGNITKAKDTYTAAYTAATKAGLSQVAAQIQQERDALE